MERLAFGIRAQRRARRRRLKRRLAFASIVMTLLGFPGATLGLELVERLIGPDPQRIARGAETSESATSLLRFRSRLFDSRPVQPEESEEQAEAEQPQTATAELTPITEIISQAAAEFGLSSDYLLSVAECESTLNHYAYSPAGYHGLFQFDFATWEAYGYGDIYNPEAQARTAARLIAAGQTERWPNCA